MMIKKLWFYSDGNKDVNAVIKVKIIADSNDDDEDCQCCNEGKDCR